MKKNSYRILKLKSGEELITKIAGGKKNKLIIDRPMIFKSSTTTDIHGQPKEITILKDWLLYATHDITSIPKDFVASFLKPDMDVIELYELEKKKDDDIKKMKPNKNRIIKNPSKDNKGFDGKQNIEDLVDMFNNIKFNKDDIVEKIMDDIQNLSDEEFEELKRESNENDSGYENYITMTLFLPPEALMTLVDSGLVDENEVMQIIKALNSDIKNMKNNNNQEFQGFKEYFDYLNRDESEFGNHWKDWSPYPTDYTKDDEDTDLI